MVKKQNLLIITPQNLNKDKSAGDYRVYCLLKHLYKYFNIYENKDTFSKLMQ